MLAIRGGLEVFVPVVVCDNDRNSATADLNEERELLTLDTCDGLLLSHFPALTTFDPAHVLDSLMWVVPVGFINALYL
jgi:hypothetical protein